MFAQLLLLLSSEIPGRHVRARRETTRESQGPAGARQEELLLSSSRQTCLSPILYLVPQWPPWRGLVCLAQPGLLYQGEELGASRFSSGL